MTIEEKAKAYDEAKARMSRAFNSNRCTIGFMNEIFPDLKEIEDERIRKAIIEFVKYKAQESLKDKWIDWLKRQGEQKPADKVEPKFKVKYAGNEYNVLEVKDIAGVTYYGIEDEPNHIDYVKADNYEIISGYGIKESGLSFPTKPVMFSEQKPAWSEEDEFRLNTVCSLLEGLPQQQNWLKSLKDRVQPKQEWGDEDEKHIVSITERIKFSTITEFTVTEDINWLKSIKGRIKGE